MRKEQEFLHVQIGALPSHMCHQDSFLQFRIKHQSRVLSITVMCNRIYSIDYCIITASEYCVFFHASIALSSYIQLES